MGILIIVFREINLELSLYVCNQIKFFSKIRLAIYFYFLLQIQIDMLFLRQVRHV